MFSPRTRGCSWWLTCATTFAKVFPAHAGMFLEDTPSEMVRLGFPRARGDVPVRTSPAGNGGGFSPRTRGCSESALMLAPWIAVFPAHAGMFLFSHLCSVQLLSFPRARGDVPHNRVRVHIGRTFSPRTRGCSWHTPIDTVAGNVFPAHAGMFLPNDQPLPRLPCFPRARGDVPLIFDSVLPTSPFSPRTRGCSGDSYVEHRHHPVFPAHAGMFLQQQPDCYRHDGFPRARGDVPEQKNRDPPTHCFPRARGDVPIWLAFLKGNIVFSPRTRGCSLVSIFDPSGDPVFPAHAGMFRNCSRCIREIIRFPRARGDVPHGQELVF